MISFETLILRTRGGGLISSGGASDGVAYDDCLSVLVVAAVAEDSDSSLRRLLMGGLCTVVPVAVDSYVVLSCLLPLPQVGMDGLMTVPVAALCL